MDSNGLSHGIWIMRHQGDCTANQSCRSGTWWYQVVSDQLSDSVDRPPLCRALGQCQLSFDSAALHSCVHLIHLCRVSAAAPRLCTSCKVTIHEQDLRHHTCECLGCSAGLSPNAAARAQVTVITNASGPQLRCCSPGPSGCLTQRLVPPHRLQEPRLHSGTKHLPRRPFGPRRCRARWLRW